MTTFPIIARRLLVAVSLFYAAGFILWRLLVASPFYGAWWWLQVSEIFGMVAYLPAPFLLVGALALRSRWIWLGLVVPLLWFGIEYGALFLPQPNVVRAESDGPTLRVMTWNTLYSAEYNNADAQAEFAATVARLQPDVILLQEVGPALLRQLREAPADWPYQTSALAGGRASLAIASKWPILAQEFTSDWQGCHCLRVTLGWRDQPIEVINIHVWAPRYDIREWQGLPVIRGFDAAHQNVTFDALLNDIAEIEQPLLVAGDFNTNERQPNYDRLLQVGLQNAHAESGWGLGLTFPRPGAVRRWLPLPLLRIDHVFYGDAWKARRVSVGVMHSSDHLYVVADLQLREQ